jgi:putative tricarboxylic transport membrane protein
MGLVLGKMVEETLKQSLLIFDQNWLLFFSRPIVVALFIVTALSVSTPLIARGLRAVRRKPPTLNPIEE